MKKALIALAVLGLTGGAAVAQSSVTLFGVVDVAARYTRSNGQNLKQLGTDGLSSSRLGVRGTEDLGGGLKAGFWLESALNADTGTVDATRFWGRRASVSLIGEFGEVRLGRGETSSFQHIKSFDAFDGLSMGDVTGVYSLLGSAIDTKKRSDNMVQYYLPTNIGGVYGSVDVAAGEGVAGKKMQGGRIGFAQGPINVSAALEQTTGTGGAKYKVTSFGGSYDFGFIKPMLNFSQTKFNALEQKIVTLGLTAPLGQGIVRASFTDAKANSAADLLAGTGDAKLYAIGYVYNVSKRTALYTNVVEIKNNGLGRFAVAGSPTVTNGQSSSGLDVGVRHAF